MAGKMEVPAEPQSGGEKRGRCVVLYPSELVLLNYILK